MMQSFAMMGLISVLSALVGSAGVGGDRPVIGNFFFAVFRGVGMDPNVDYSAPFRT